MLAHIVCTKQALWCFKYVHSSIAFGIDPIGSGDAAVEGEVSSCSLSKAEWTPAMPSRREMLALLCEYFLLPDPIFPHTSATLIDSAQVQMTQVLAKIPCWRRNWK